MGEIEAKRPSEDVKVHCRFIDGRAWREWERGLREWSEIARRQTKEAEEEEGGLK